MDNFTLAVVIGDILMCVAFIAIIALDKPRPAMPVTEPAKPAGKRQA